VSFADANAVGFFLCDLLKDVKANYSRGIILDLGFAILLITLDTYSYRVE
jgi:hypothetical protein